MLIDADGNARLADFGLVAISESQAFSTTMTRSDKGSLRFMAPELFEPRALRGRASDVYAFGMTILEVQSYYMLS